MLTATKNLMLPATVTGSWPRPRWFDVSMWGKSIDTCMMDVRFREKFQDALAVVVSEQERAGLDLITHGDYHCDEDMAGRAWHHYPLQRWAGFEGDYLQPEETRAPWLHYPPGTLLNEIYTGWRWPHVVDKIEHRPLVYPKIWRIAQGKTQKPVRFGTCCSQVMALFLDIHTKKYKDKRQIIWDMAEAMNAELLALRDAGCRLIQIEEPTFHFMEDTSYAASMEIYLERCRGDVWTLEMKDRNQRDIELFAPFRNDLKKKICIGAVSHRTLQADRAEDVAGEIRKALKHIPVEQLIISSDCGFGRQGCNREIAFYKATAIAQGCNIVRAELGLPTTYIPATDQQLQIDVVERQRP